MKIVKCKKCGKWIDLDLGDKGPAEYPDRTGTKDDPLPPGDYDDICVICGYGY